MPSVDELERTYWDAKRKADEIDTAIRAFREKRMNEHEKLVQETINDNFGEALRAAREARTKAEQELIAERDRLAREGFGAEYPVGARFVEWRSGGRFGHGHTWRPTGQLGVYEIITSDSEHPENSSWRARVGEPVIRLLNKRGGPGRRYVKIREEGSDLPWGWYPEGVDPNDATKEE